MNSPANVLSPIGTTITPPYSSESSSLASVLAKNLILDSDHFPSFGKNPEVSWENFKKLLLSEFSEEVVSESWDSIFESLALLFRQPLNKRVEEEFEFVYRRGNPKKGIKKGDKEIRTRIIEIPKDLSELRMCFDFYRTALTIVSCWREVSYQNREFLNEDSNLDEKRFLSHLVWYIKYRDAELMRESQSMKCRTGSLSMLSEHGDKNGVQGYKLTDIPLTCGSWHCVHCSAQNATKMSNKLGPAMETYNRLDDGLTWFTLTIDRSRLTEKYKVEHPESLDMLSWSVINFYWSRFKSEFINFIDSEWISYCERNGIKDRLQDKFADNLFDRPMFVRKVEVQKNGSAHLHCVVRDPRLVLMMKEDIKVWRDLQEYEKWDRRSKKWVCVRGRPPQDKAEYTHITKSGFVRKSRRWQEARVVNTSRAEEYIDPKNGELLLLHGPHHRFKKFIVDQCYKYNWGRMVDIDIIDTPEAVSNYLTISKSLIREMSKQTQTEGVVVPRNSRIYDCSNNFSENAAVLRQRFPPRVPSSKSSGKVMVLHDRENNALREELEKLRIDRYHDENETYKKVLSLSISSKISSEDRMEDTYTHMQDIYHQAGIQKPIIRELQSYKHFEVMVSKGEEKPETILGQDIHIPVDDFVSLGDYSLDSLHSLDSDLFISIFLSVIRVMGLSKRDCYKDFVDSYSSFDVSEEVFDFVSSYISNESSSLLEGISMKLDRLSVRYRKIPSDKILWKLETMKEIFRLRKVMANFVFKSPVLFLVDILYRSFVVRSEFNYGKV